MSGTTRCKSCGATWPASTGWCGHCGERLGGGNPARTPGAGSERRPARPWAIVGLSLVVALTVALGVWLMRTPGPGAVGLTQPAASPDEHPTTRSGLSALPGAPECLVGRQRFPCVLTRLATTEGPNLSIWPWEEGEAIFLAQGGRVMRLDLDGREQWRRLVLPSADPSIAMIVGVTDDLVMVTTGHESHDEGPSSVFGLATTTGQPQWRLDLHRPVWDVRLTQDRIFVNIAGSMIVAFDRADHHEVWRHESQPVEGTRLSVDPPALVTETFELVRPDGDYEVTATTWTCLDPSDGSVGVVVDDPRRCPGVGAPGPDTFPFRWDSRTVHSAGGDPWVLPPDEYVASVDGDAMATLEVVAAGFQLRLRRLADGQATLEQPLDLPRGRAERDYPTISLTPSLLIASQMSNNRIVTRAFHRANGEPAWELEDSGLWDVITSTTDHLYGYSDRGELKVHDVRTGRPLWAWQREAWMVVERDDRLLIVAHDGIWIIDPPV